jgi:hypothetical protein
MEEPIYSIFYPEDGGRSFFQNAARMYQTTRGHVLEVRNLDIHRREN